MNKFKHSGKSGLGGGERVGKRSAEEKPYEGGGNARFCRVLVSPVSERHIFSP